MPLLSKIGEEKHDITLIKNQYQYFSTNRTKVHVPMTQQPKACIRSMHQYRYIPSQRRKPRPVVN